ncbi:MAG: chemotaxis response regulator protein-glutamate methylesterase [Nitrospirae bacterium]|nr:chemotaxis response regulator protein-glutamate methylesterase [Nitrospirota bacterium]
MRNSIIRVLCVDDSAFVRKILTDELGRQPDIRVVACANDPIEARDVLLSQEVDVMILDVEMPRMDGITFLEQLMAKRPMPVVMFSTLTQQGGEMAMRALSLGAVDVVGKPTNLAAMRNLGVELAEKVRVAAAVDVTRHRPSFISKPQSLGGGGIYRRPLLLLGASTGGTEALRAVFAELPADTPGTLVVQHMPAHFTHSFAQSLDRVSAMTVREAKDGDLVQRGVALVAPGGLHMVVEGSPAAMRVRLKEGPPVCHQKPAVDVLFKSAARGLGQQAVAAVLTGMGHDGADGIVELKRAGTLTVAQDALTSVVYGMPRAAKETGCVDQVVSLQNIARTVLELLTHR